MSITKDKISKEEYKSLNSRFEELNSKGENEKRIDSKLKYVNWFNNHSGMKNKIENMPILSPTEYGLPINKNISKKSNHMVNGFQNIQEKVIYQTKIFLIIF